MVYVVIICIVAILYFFYIPFRVVSSHPISTPVYVAVDIFNYFRYRRFDLCPTGRLDCYCAHFGGGKTLSIVSYVVSLYKRYHDKRVYDDSLCRFVTQKIHVLSNVEFTSIPFTRLDSLQQVVEFCMHNKLLDSETNCRTCIIVVIDEASSQLNSRNFKSNINADFLNTLITSRHYHMSIFYSSQKFKLTDKLLRDVTQRVFQCHKYWRIMVQYVYNADDLEYASDPTVVRPVDRRGFFIYNRYFRAYDTLAVVDKLKKDVDSGNMMSSDEILRLRDNAPPNDDVVGRPSRRLLKRRKRKGA